LDVKIAITQANDELAIMTFLTIGRGSILPAGAVWADKETGQWMRPATQENINDEVRRSGFLAHPIKGWRIIQESDIPKDRTYRNALRDRGDRLDWDMPAARELHRDKIRHARALAFLKLDGDWMRAQGQGKIEEVRAVETKRQELRDLPSDPRIEAASSIEELKEIWNGDLPPRD
jgi:hypothetical protein